MNEANESRRRRVAIAIFGFLLAIFIVISGASFAQGYPRPDPNAIVFQGHTAVEGKRVFQAYNCMGCHTLVGNGAYFAPDITAVYSGNGPAWLMSFLTTLDVWPSKAMVDPWVDRLRQSGDLAVTSTDAYYALYQGAGADVVDRGGWGLLMPNIHLKESEAAALVAYLDYVSRLNTQGWPPESQANADVVQRIQDLLHPKFLGVGPTATPAP